METTSEEGQSADGELPFHVALKSPKLKDEILSHHYAINVLSKSAIFRAKSWPQFCQIFTRKVVTLKIIFNYLSILNLYRLHLSNHSATFYSNLSHERKEVDKISIKIYDSWSYVAKED